MSLKGELTDLSLAELIEFFCNQRKTGRLTVSYPHAPAYFYLHSGMVVHASIGSLRGIEAVYFALTQSNASFNFSTAYEAPDQTINQPWTSVVLEGLRRMDEGIKPRNPFEETTEVVEEQPTAKPMQAPVVPPAVTPPPAIEFESENLTTPLAESPTVHSAPIPVARVIEHTPVVAPRTIISKPIVKQEAKVEPKDEVVVEKVLELETPKALPVSDAFLSSTQHAAKFSGSRWKLAAVLAALILIVAGISVPWGLRARGKAAAPNQLNQPTAAAQPQEDAQSASANDAPVQPSDEANTSPASSEATDAARREREARLREEARLKARAAEANAATAPTPNSVTQSPSSTTAAQSTATGPKKAVVTVTYDENGRVTQASGSDPTALRIARQKRFPPGKAGSATITIPIN